jgi:PAS domain S-box-containing protein
MNNQSWTKEFPAAITICDADGIIIEMNNKSIETFKNYGGAELIGKNLYDCHPGDSKNKLRQLMDSQKENVYTIEKNGVKKIIYQSPQFENGQFNGLVEISFEIPWNMPHSVRE